MNDAEIKFAGRLMKRWAIGTAVLYPVAAPVTVWQQLQEGGPWFAAVVAGLAGPVAISAAIFMLVWFCLVIAMALGWCSK